MRRQIFRTSVVILDQETKPKPIHNWQWVVMDGPVDTLWVENMNTVLDDTKILCLANGERIPLTPSIRMIFEVDSLSQASPATISRCGMVYLDPTDLGWRPFVRSWLNKLREKKVIFSNCFIFSLHILSDTNTSLFKKVTLNLTSLQLLTTLNL